MSTDTTFDPWLKLRDLTSLRNDLALVLERYEKMRSYAIAQYQDLKERKGTATDTLDGLLGVTTFCSQKIEPIRARIEAVERKMEVETEKLNNASIS